MEGSLGRGRRDEEGELKGRYWKEERVFKVRKKKV
jgi:hypothetical protein